MTRVRWIVGRRKALARGLAMSLAEARGLRWFEIPLQTRDAMIRDADETVGEWISGDVLAQFLHGYREKE